MPATERTAPSRETVHAGKEAFDSFSSAVTQAAERSRSLMEASLEAWTREAQRYQEELTQQGASALDQLRNCKTPLDVISVEQAWLAARQKAYLETGLRFAQTFAAIAQAGTDARSPPAHAA